MIFIYGIVVIQIPDLRDDPAKFVLFTVLMVVHAALYWLPLLFPFNTKQGLIYLSSDGFGIHIDIDCWQSVFDIRSGCAPYRSFPRHVAWTCNCDFYHHRTGYIRWRHGVF